MEQAKPAAFPRWPIATAPIARRRAPIAVVIATEWEQFRALDLGRLKSVMAQPVIVDLRNIYRADEMKRAKFAISQSAGPGGIAPAA